jgi:hypothetical protein
VSCLRLRACKTELVLRMFVAYIMLAHLKPMPPHAANTVCCRHVGAHACRAHQRRTIPCTDAVSVEWSSLSELLKEVDVDELAESEHGDDDEGDEPGEDDEAAAAPATRVDDEVTSPAGLLLRPRSPHVCEMRFSHRGCFECVANPCPMPLLLHGGSPVVAYR